MHSLHKSCIKENTNWALSRGRELGGYIGVTDPVCPHVFCCGRRHLSLSVTVQHCPTTALPLPPLPAPPRHTHANDLGINSHNEHNIPRVVKHRFWSDANDLFSAMLLVLATLAGLILACFCW